MTVLRSGSASDVGRVRTVNQDLPLERPNLFAVADGMGGHVGGEVAARVAVETLEQAFEESLAWLADPERSTPTPPPADRLTRREREVVALLALGQTNRQVAAELVLAEGTVENYVQRILGKLGVNNRAQIAVWAVAHGHGRPPQTPKPG